MSEADRGDFGWRGVVAAAAYAEQAERANRPQAFALDGHSLRAVAGGADTAVLTWTPSAGWAAALADDDARKPMLDLYLPICGATLARPITVAHLGQSVDGFIATHAGESRWVTGHENVLHMHRLRALCDAVVVGAGTVAADDPQLTTRLVDGGNPLRVVLDPTCRLGDHHRVFQDDAAETIYVCGRTAMPSAERRFGRAEVIALDDAGDGTLDAVGVVRLLRERGCARVFVEGGGVTVSMFLEANALDRLHVTIAPLLIGDGRPAIRLPPRAALGDCHRPRYRVFRMGGDVLFDLDLASGDDDAASPSEPIARVI